MEAPETILEFDLRGGRRARLDQLQARLRGAFAAACAERLTLRAERNQAPGSSEARRALDDLWMAFSEGCAPDLAADLAALEALGDVLDQDHCAAAAYAVQAFDSGQAQEADWAAQRAFETAFEEANNPAATGFAALEEDAQHPSVQAEYLLQASQLALIERESVTAETIARLRSV